VEADSGRTKRGSESETVTCPGIPTRVKAREKWPGGTGVPGPCGKAPFLPIGEFRRHMSPASSGRVAPSRDMRPGSQAVSGIGPRHDKKWRRSNKPAANRVTPPVPWFRNQGRTQSVKADSCYCEPVRGSAIQRFWTNLKKSRCNRPASQPGGEKGYGRSRIECSQRKAPGKRPGDDREGAIRSEPNGRRRKGRRPIEM